MSTYKEADAECFLRVLRAIDATAAPKVMTFGESGLNVEAANGSWLAVEGSTNEGPASGVVSGYDSEGERADGAVGRNFYPEG